MLKLLSRQLLEVEVQLLLLGAEETRPQAGCRLAGALYRVSEM
jgi:hypothetical protein